MDMRKLLNGKSDNAFEGYVARNFWRSFARSVAGPANRELFKRGAMREAGGRYEPFVMPAIERAIEAVIARQIRGMNYLYPPGNYSMLSEKFRVSVLSKSANPIYWGYAKIPFEKTYAHGPDSYYKRQYTQWNKKMTYTNYDFAPFAWLKRCHDIILNQKNMDKAEKSRMMYSRKPFHTRVTHEELTFLLAVIPACIHENLEFLNEIRAGDHTYMEHNPIITVDMVLNASER